MLDEKTTARGRRRDGGKGGAGMLSATTVEAALEALWHQASFAPCIHGEPQRLCTTVFNEVETRVSAAVEHLVDNGILAADALVQAVRTTGEGREGWH